MCDLSLWPGLEIAPPALEDDVLTSGPLGEPPAFASLSEMSWRCLRRSTIRLSKMFQWFFFFFFGYPFQYHSLGFCSLIRSLEIGHWVLQLGAAECAGYPGTSDFLYKLFRICLSIAKWFAGISIGIHWLDKVYLEEVIFYQSLKSSIRGHGIISLRLLTASFISFFS